VHDRAIIVLDIGKTHAKLSLWEWDGVVIERRVRANTTDGVSLDASGVEGWLAETLTGYAKLAHVGALIPVTHGAAVAIVRDGALVAPPRDYEADIPANVSAEYRALRDSFDVTGSPALPLGLNLGAQLYAQRELLSASTVLLYPQYWAWLLSGVAASEVTSLGCHTDLWKPAEAKPSALAEKIGVAAALPPLCKAGDVLGPITPAWAERTGLPSDTQIYCGLHDSNAALLAARGFLEINAQEATVLSTGTWFIAMRTPASAVDLTALPEARDCLVNVDANGVPTPSARWMGGREIELLTDDGLRIDDPDHQAEMLASVADVVREGAMVLPCFAKGCGPFGGMQGGWISEPSNTVHNATAIALYAAFITHESLSLVGARNRILIEGRFAASGVFTRALASLRPHDTIYATNAHNDVSFGALRLVNPALKASGTLNKIAPLAIDLLPYAAAWRHTVAQQEGKA
jgi:sugar (pentulose or hexulose) kinase